MSYSFARVAEGSVEEVVERVRAALADEGFGVLTEADISATMKAKLDVDFPPYVILGACNPPLAKQALEAEPEIGVLLPCNVVVRQHESGDTEVIAMDPAAVLSLVDAPGVEIIANEVKNRLGRVLAAV